VGLATDKLTAFNRPVLRLADPHDSVSTGTLLQTQRAGRRQSQGNDKTNTSTVVRWDEAFVVGGYHLGQAHSRA